MEPIRIAMIANNLDSNGISYVIVNYCEHLDTERFAVTVIAGEPVFPPFRERLLCAGVTVREMPSRKNSSKAYYRALYKELSRKKYDVVHVHGNSCTIAVEMMIAKLRGIRVRLAHSHNTSCTHLRMHKRLRPLFNACCTGGLACSEEAGRWLFEDKPFTVLPNGFDTRQFVFDDAVRLSVRAAHGFEDKFVIGCVGRINDQKNHPYLLRIFEQVAAAREDALLLIVGDGPDAPQLQALIERHPFRNRIVCLGATGNVRELYNAMDVFVLPSKFEGLGIVFLEAQINGLYCVTSDQVPQAARLGDTIAFLPLTEDVTPWAQTILEAPPIDRPAYCDAHRKAIGRYEITRSVRVLEQTYTAFAERKQK